VTKTRHFVKIAVLFAVLAASVSCGKKSSTSASTDFSQTVTGTVTPFATNSHSVSVGQSGTMTLTLTWADSSVDLDLYLASSSCTNLFAASCSVLQQSITSTGTSERITRTVTKGDTFTAFVDSLSLTKSQAYSVLFTIN